MIGKPAGQHATATLILLALGHAASAPLAPQDKVRTYSIESSQSQITVLASQEGLMSKLRPNHRIAVKTFSGSVRLPPGEGTQVALELEAEARSLTNIDKDISDLERREFQATLHDTVMETTRFPKIKFQSVSVTDLRTSGEGRSFTLNGDLTLHGVTKRVAVPVTVIITPGQLRATGEAKLKQTDFEMKPYSGGFGAIKIGDEVKVSFVIVAKPR